MMHLRTPLIPEPLAPGEADLEKGGHGSQEPLTEGVEMTLMTTMIRPVTRMITGKMPRKTKKQ